MSASSQCPHPDFAFNVAVARIENDTIKMADITGRCTVCNKPASFRYAVPIGLRWDSPTLSPDWQELRLPFVIEGDTVDENKPRGSYGIDLKRQEPSR